MVVRPTAGWGPGVESSNAWCKGSDQGTAPPIQNTEPNHHPLADWLGTMGAEGVA